MSDTAEIPDGRQQHPVVQPDKALARALRPADAASLVLIDRAGPGFRVLMGKRHANHVFMPGTYVFPGGRRERRDSHLRPARDLDRNVIDKLLLRMPTATSPARARALAVAAIRETHEETGLRFAPGSGRDFRPDLSRLRFVARAVTPPGQPRRFDARFFACFTDETAIDPASATDSNELIDLHWTALSDIGRLCVPRITRIVLEDIAAALAADPTLPQPQAVPFYYRRRGTFVHELL